MLTSTLLASISHRTSTATTHTKDASIFTLSFQPPSALPSSILKKSTTPRNALAASSTHVFAAQSDRAALHVYARASGQHQTLIPLRERATALTCAYDGALVIWATETGALVLWETHTGRTVRTLDAHLGKATALAVDRPGTFAISAGDDGAVMVWCLPAILGFGAAEDWRVCSREPVRSFRSAHKGAVVDVKIGHGLGAANIAVSAGEDKSVILWDYHEGTQLRTILLPEAPTCLALDPCDRGVLCGFADGSAVGVDFMSMDGEQSVKNPVWDEKRQARDAQVSADAKWKSPAEDVGAVSCAATSYDGTKLLTGHESGNIIVWDIPTARYSAHLTSTPLPGPVSNITMLEVTGSAGESRPKLTIKEVVKPRFGDLDTNDGSIPDNYKITARLVGDIPFNKTSAAQASSDGPSTEVEKALCHPSFPPDLLADSIADLEAYGRGGALQQPTNSNGESDFMALDDVTTAGKEAELQKEVEDLKRQIGTLQRLQSESFAQLTRLGDENKALARKAESATEGQLAADLAQLKEAEKSWGGKQGRSSR